MPLVAATRAKAGPNLLSRSCMNYCGACPYGVASRSGTRHPGIRGRPCHADMDHPSRFQCYDEEGLRAVARINRSPESASQAQLPAEWVRRNVLHFCPRGGFVRTPRIYFWMVRLHTRMPKFHHSPRILSAPKTAVVRRHLSDQGHRFGGENRAYEKPSLTSVSTSCERAPDATAALSLVER